MALLGICDAMFGCMFRQWGSNYRTYLWPQPGQKWETCGSDMDGNHICLFSYTGFLSRWLISSSVYIFCIFGFWDTFWILKQVSPFLISVWESHTLTFWSLFIHWASVPGPRPGPQPPSLLLGKKHVWQEPYKENLQVNILSWCSEAGGN